MKAICVDDEALILQLTVSLCRELPQLDEVKGFTRALEALAWLEEHSADIALLDIDMPGINGLVLAKAIKEKSPDTAIIFLTGYSQYAVDAFAIHASGYLMKPISRERLSAEVDYAISGRVKRPVSRVTVRTFGNFEILAEGQAVTFSRSKAKELLAYLVDKQGSGVTRAEAFAALWEDGVYDRRMQKQLDVVLRSLRETLQRYGIDDILEVQKGSLRICPEKLDCDLYRFLQGDADAINAYRGEYMSSYAWAEMTEAYMTQSQLKRNMI